MANVFTAIIRNINQPFMKILQEKAAIPALVDTDFKTIPAALGQNITVPITPVITPVARTNAMIPTLSAGQTPTVVSIQITQDYTAKFQLSGDDWLALNAPDPTPGFIPNNMIEAIRSIRNMIAVGCYQNICASATAAAGTAGSDPFAAPTTLGPLLPNASDINQYLNDSLAPDEDRNMILSTSALAQLSQNPLLLEVNKSGNPELLRKGMLGQLLGLQVTYDQLIQSPAIGTGTAYVLSAATAVGDSTLSVGTGSGTVVVGDLLQIAGDPSYYVAASAIVAGVITLNVASRAGYYPNSGFVNQVNNTGAAVTIVAKGSRMPVFQRGALKLVARPSAMPIDGDQAVSSAIFQDPGTGLAMRLNYYKGYGVNQWEVQCAWGYKTIRPELAKVLIGK